MSDPSYQPQSPMSPPPANRRVVLIGVAVVALAVIFGAIVFLGGDDGGSNELAGDIEGSGDRTDTRGRDVEVPEPDPDPDPDPDPTTTTEPRDNCPTAGEILDRDALPAPDTTAAPLELQIDRAGRGTEYPFTFGGEGWPYVGEIFVPVTPGEYTDVPIHLEPGQQAVIFAANDCIKGSVEIYSPSGEQIGLSEDLGEPGVVEGWEFASGDEIVEAGTHVFRVIQDTGTDSGGFVLRFYAPVSA